MDEEKKKPISLSVGENSFELVLRILGNEFIAIRIGSTNFSGKLIAGGVLLLFFTFKSLFPCAKVHMSLKLQYPFSL